MLKISDSSELNHLYPEEEQHVSKFAALLNHKSVILIINEINTAIYNLERNANAKILFLNLSVKFGKLINPKNVNL
jgi:DNA polymerase-3 subunit delta'